MPRKRRNKAVVEPDDETEDTDTGLQNTKPTRTLRRRQVVGQPDVEIPQKPKLNGSKKKRINHTEPRKDNDSDDKNGDNDDDELKNVKTKILLRQRKLKYPSPSTSATMESNIIHMKNEKVDKKKLEVLCDLPKRSLRCRNDRSNNILKNDGNETSGSNYDADSENDVKKSTAETKNTKYKTNTSLELKKCNTKKNIQKHDNIHFIKAECCQLRSEVLSKSSPSHVIGTIYDNKLEKANGLHEKINYTKVKNSQTDIISVIDHPKNKENHTPRDTYSTPAVNRKLDDSLFGFNALLTPGPLPLPFSPVIGDTPNINNTTNTFVTDSKLNLHKRGFEFDDMPIQIPKKKQKKKGVKVVTVAKDALEDLRSQFAEVEMHELVVE